MEIVVVEYYGYFEALNPLHISTYTLTFLFL